jgi:hypothetical protein
MPYVKCTIRLIRKKNATKREDKSKMERKKKNLDNIEAIGIY